MIDDGVNPLLYFGEKWDAPMTDDAEQTDVPTELSCMYCQERFEEGDQGILYPTGYAGHKECNLRGVMGGIGHQVDHSYFCHGELGTDAGLSYRLSAILVWQWWVEGKRFTRAELEMIRNDHV